MVQESRLLRGDVRSALIRFALPFLGASLLQFIYGAVDMLIVGRYCDPASIVAVSNGAQIMQILTLTVVGLTAGLTVLVGQHLGAGRREDMERTFLTGVVLYVPIALTVFLLLFFGHRTVISLMQTPAAAVEHARRYLMICSVGAPFIVGYNVVSATLRALGDSRRPMIFIAVSCVTNIAGDLILVGGFGLGVSGAAIATLGAQVLCFLLSLSVLRLPQFPLPRAGMRPRRAVLAQLLKISMPLALQNLLVELSFLLITIIVNRIGLEQAAAVGIVERILGVGFLGASAFSAAVSAMTAQNIGADQPDRARRAALWGTACSVAIGCVFYVCFLLFSRQLVSLFTDDAVVIGHGVQYLTIYGSDCVLVGIVFCMNGFFNGCARAGFTMFNSLFSTFAVRVPLSYFISVLPGTTMLHLGAAAPAASAVQIVLQLLYLSSGRWRARPAPAADGGAA